MNQVFLTFTFKSDSGHFLLVQTVKGARIIFNDDNQIIAFDQIDSLIDALKALQANATKSEVKSSEVDSIVPRNGGEEVLSSGQILPPFNFDSNDKLSALVGRKVRLRNGIVTSVYTVDLDCSKDEEKIRHSEGWVYRDGTFHLGCEDRYDIVEVCPVNE